MDNQQPCPCGSTQTYGECCGPLHAGQAASTPEALMRSRFTAFALKNTDYLRQTWHPSTRPATLTLEDAPEWTSLTIQDTKTSGRQGMVHFQAVFRENAQWGYLEEKSYFERENDRWFYLTGKPEQGILKPGRNDRCPCGSGRKYKSCCLGTSAT